MTLDLAFRAADEADRPFVYHSYMHSARKFFPPMGNEAFNRGVLHPFIAHVVSGVALLVVAYEPSGDSGQILGWLCWSAGDLPVVRYAYTKHIFRRLGVCEALLRHVFGLRTDLGVSVPVQDGLMTAFGRRGYSLHRMAIIT